VNITKQRYLEYAFIKIVILIHPKSTNIEIALCLFLLQNSQIKVCMPVTTSRRFTPVLCSPTDWLLLELPRPLHGDFILTVSPARVEGLNWDFFILIICQIWSTKMANFKRSFPCWPGMSLGTFGPETGRSKNKQKQIHWFAC